MSKDIVDYVVKTKEWTSKTPLKNSPRILSPIQESQVDSQPKQA